MNRTSLVSATLLLAALVAGCSRQTDNTVKASPQQVQAARQQQASDRELLDEIPPPAKSRYMAIRQKGAWDNPFLTVSSKTVSLRVMNPPPPHTGSMTGSFLQPVSARRNRLELRLSDLPEALASIPQDRWPYGRVIAVEEDPHEGRANRVQVRRNVETTLQMLNNLGVVAYEWPGAR
ncbi:MAG TPA: hypothetical protein VGT04_14505 [Acidobacteriaceae bacterium]|nr:hypothetical protein [Acidobacteriaceae bacterium]